MNLKVGTASWSIPKEFKHHFPSKQSQLEAYSKVFNCVEINTTFYKSHKPETFEKWVKQTPAQFEFSLKLNRLFTHQSDLKPRVKDLKENLLHMSHLGLKWKVLLLQFPAKQKFYESRVARFYELLRRHYNGAIVVEPRNLTWLCKESKTLMKEFKISKVIADPQVCPHDSKEILSSGSVTYFRLHGSPEIYRSSYSDEFLTSLKDELDNYKKPWCIFDNTANGKATGNALKLLEMR